MFWRLGDRFFKKVRVVVIGEKLEGCLFEIIASIKQFGCDFLFLKKPINAKISPADILVADCSLTSQLVNYTKIISVLTTPDYRKQFQNEMLINMFSLKDIGKIIEKFASEQSLPIIADDNSVNLYNIADRIARTDATILISGETGTGKEILAKYIHNASNRADRKFIAVNCAAIPDTLLESEFFGHERGAFTNAYQRKIGKFEEANHGTILLDEISEMSLTLQAKLLRVIQEKEFFRLGGNERIKSDVRIIATSNKNLEQAVAEGVFREDLFYRLNIIPLEILPLRERKLDIVPLATYFCKKYSNSQKKLSPNLLNELKSKKWKGNVRELENFVHRAVILSSKDIIDVKDVFFGSLTDKKNLRQSTSEQKTLAQIEKETILAALEKFAGNKTCVSEKLGIPARTLRYKLNAYKKAEREKLINLKEIKS